MDQNGILVIDKPTGVSSHDCVRHVRRVFGTKKVGHAGTLDVEASGVLLLGLNKGTKLLSYLSDNRKAYRFSVFFGRQTTTHDHVGTTVAEHPVETLAALDQAMISFVGPYMQTPPAYSAVKHQGKKLYEYAREAGVVPEVAPRERWIYDFRRLSEPRADGTGYVVDFHVETSKGMYVRQLAFDLANALGTIAHTTAIRRVSVGTFAMADACPLATVTETTPLVSLAAALPSLPEVVADDAMRRRVNDGRSLTLTDTAPRVKILDSSGRLLAIYERKGDVFRARHVLI